jgi:anaphase-promoting complex subunit 6
VLKADPWHARCLPLHVSLLVELKEANTLFQLAHGLVDLYPEWSLAWFAVGCYYYLTGRQDPARRYLQKATQLDRLLGPAWLAYGHSFAVENEHDQAMAAYFKACQLMRGCHLPLLYIGLEYSLTNNQQLAERFFSQALEIAPHDPFVLHELGVTAFQVTNMICRFDELNLCFAQSGQLEVAEGHLRAALQAVEAVGEQGEAGLAEKWESLLSNLGHTCRKLGRYQEALAFHQQALVLRPLNPATYSAIGYVQVTQSI